MSDRGYGPKQVIKYRVLRRDKHICAYCGGKATTVDHKIPIARGGSNGPSNLVASCKVCNHAKGAWASYELFKRLVRRYGQVTLDDVRQTNHWKMLAMHNIWNRIQYGNVTPLKFLRIVQTQYPDDYKRLIHRFFNSLRANNV